MTASRNGQATPDILVQDDESRRVHDWRVSRLAGLGLTWPVAEAVADRIDWHEVARLVRRGCPPSLAVAILN